MGPAELGMARGHGIHPVATVSALCVTGQGRNEDYVTRGWKTALARLASEAAACGAHAVVDVRFRKSTLGKRYVVDRLTGTAIRIDGLPPSATPVTATVSMTEFILLLQTGIVPLGLAIGASYKSYRPRMRWMTYLRRFYGMSGSRLDGLSRFWEKTQRQAFEKVTADARQQGGSVLVQSLRSDFRHEDAYTGRCLVLGTIVDAGPSGPGPHALHTVIDLRDEGSPFADTTSLRTSFPTGDKI
jgi:uncharacterized protein YbjQ (UPF0145 family)